MSCQVAFPIDEIVDAVIARLDISTLGGVLESELNQKVLAAVQPKIDAVNKRITNIPTEKFIVSQVLQGNELVITLNDGTTIDTDVSALL